MKYQNISFIIPCLNEAAEIKTNLEKLQYLRKQGHEIIISDGGSTDNTLSLIKGLVDQCINSPSGRAKQMNAGAKKAHNNILCFLHADTIACKNIDTHILHALNHSKKHWGFFNIKLSGKQWQFRIIEKLINIRSCLSHIATGDQGIFITKKTFNKISGFANIPLMEDIELSKRLKKISKPACIKNKPLITSSRRWEKHDIIKTVLLMWQLRLRYFLGTPSTTLAKAYRTHSENNTKQLIVFVKAPIPGQCKTRLTPYLNTDQASEFYKQLVLNCFENLSSNPNIDLTIYTTPDIENDFIKNLSRNYSAPLHLQKGNDLGERMFNAINASLSQYKQSVLIGTDCPFIDQDYIDKAFKALDQHDMVMGPARDGGYVLIGATKIEQNLFKNIRWSTNSVLTESLKNHKTAGYTTHLLDTLWDIDTPEDYTEYQSLLNKA